MNYKKYQQVLSVILGAILIIGIILISAGLVIKKSDRQTIMAAEDPIQGYRISPPFPLDGIKNVITSTIEWEVEMPEGTRITIETAITADGEDPPEPDDPRWNEYEIEQPEGSISILGIEPGVDLTSQYLWTKQILETDNPAITPKLHWLTETITTRGVTEGWRISPEFDISGISGQDTVKDSRIFWQAKERFDGTVKVEVNIFDGTGWNGWQEVVNGTSIRELEPGTSLSGAEIQTKTSFIGGPVFYPELENIKIFIELE